MQKQTPEATIAAAHDRDRGESLKAGLVGACGSTIAFCLLLFCRLLFCRVGFAEPSWLPIHILLEGAIAFASGFLFGITYRYVVRMDANPHLKTGAVTAFALVRGLAVVGERFPASSAISSLLLPMAESAIWFAIAQVLLELCLRHGWVAGRE